MIVETWTRIKAWGSEHAPEMLADLNPGATEEQLSTVEATLGVQIPEEFRNSLKVHNGEGDGWPNKVFADLGTYLGTDRIIEEWEQRLLFGQAISQGMEGEDMQRLIRDGVIIVEGPVKPVGFIQEWIPIMECNGDVFWAIDLSPAQGGVQGQVIEVDWESCSWMVVANSFGELLSSYASSLELGEYRIVNGLPTRELDE